MKVIQVHLGLLPIPPNGWGAVEKIIWEYHQNLNENGLPCEIKYLNDIVYSDDTIVHVHVANLANECHKKGIPYIFTIHDHHAYLYGKNSSVYKENLQAIKNSVISTCPAKYLVDYFGSEKLKYFPHAVNTDQFIFENRVNSSNKLLCVANNGYANDPTADRKGFTYAIKAAKELNLPITIAGPSNNKKYFENLDEELNNYEKLNKVFDLNEKDLIRLYNEHDIFIHASELEAGHPNLTLLEAMSCGLPVIGTFEENQFDGMIVVNRNVEEIKIAIKSVIKNYSKYQRASLESASKNSYKNRIKELIGVYDLYTEKLFGYKHKRIYDTVTKTVKENIVKNAYFNFKFDDRAFLEVSNSGNPEQEFNVKFISKADNQIKYECNLKHGWWGACNFTYYMPYNIQIRSGDELVEDYHLNLENKKVLIEYEANALGDQLAWMPIIEQFRKKHNCRLYVKFPLNSLFENKYPNINFIKEKTEPFFATYKLGWYVDASGVNSDRHKRDPRKLSLQQVASDYLGLEYKPEKPLIDFKVKDRPIKEKYVVIATQSTAQSKYWNYKGGWEILVDHLNSLGFKVICIDLHKIFGNGKDYVNVIPKNALDFTGNKPLEDRINQIYHSSFFIGLPSGLSWLAWSVGVPVVLISGFSYPYTEFKTQYRVQNHKVCTGCWNDDLFDKGNWKWCPKPDKKELFECTKSITPEMVIETVNRLIKDKNL
jgi:autotransporter strand-loop-strand O-heptosyltransferase